MAPLFLQNLTVLAIEVRATSWYFLYASFVPVVLCAFLPETNKTIGALAGKKSGLTVSLFAPIVIFGMFFLPKNLKVPIGWVVLPVMLSYATYLFVKIMREGRALTELSPKARFLLNLTNLIYFIYAILITLLVSLDYIKGGRYVF